VTVNAVDSTPITPDVGPDSVADVGGAAALYVIGEPLYVSAGDVVIETLRLPAVPPGVM